MSESRVVSSRGQTVYATKFCKRLTEPRGDIMEFKAMRCCFCVAERRRYIQWTTFKPHAVSLGRVRTVCAPIDWLESLARANYLLNIETSSNVYLFLNILLRFGVSYEHQNNHNNIVIWTQRSIICCQKHSSFCNRQRISRREHFSVSKKFLHIFLGHGAVHLSRFFCCCHNFSNCNYL